MAAFESESPRPRQTMDIEMEMEMQLALALSLAQSISVPSAGGASSSNAVRLGSVVTLGSVDRLAPFRGPHRCRRRASIHGEPLLPLHQALPTLLAALVAAACSVAAACLTSRTTDLRQVSATWNTTHEQPNNVLARVVQRRHGLPPKLFGSWCGSIPSRQRTTTSRRPCHR